MKASDAIHKSRAWRSPAFGVIPAKAYVTVSVEIPIDLAREEPIILTVKKYGTVSIRDIRTTSVSIENTTNRPVPYMMVIVSKMALSLPKMKWRDRLQLLAHRFMNEPKGE
jgi:hypothetical protein